MEEQVRINWEEVECTSLDHEYVTGWLFGMDLGASHWSLHARHCALGRTTPFLAPSSPTVWTPQVAGATSHIVMCSLAEQQVLAGSFQAWSSMFERLQQLQHAKDTKVFGRGGAGCILTKDAGCACPWPPTSRSTWEIPWTSRDSTMERGQDMLGQGWELGISDSPTPRIVYKDTAYLLLSVWVRVYIYIYVVPAIVIAILLLSLSIYIYIYMNQACLDWHDGTDCAPECHKKV